MSKQGRNDLCACGSGEKFKRCCYGTRTPRALPPEIGRMLAEQEAAELIRTRQQGLGRPIIAIEHGEHKLVAVNNRMISSKGWKTFPDFLQYFIKDKLDPAWGNKELAKPFTQRHPIIQWYDAYCLYQRRWINEPGTVSSGEVTGIVACYLGLAYSLYLMEHNADLQAKMIARLKDPGQFQGAYFEMVVASALIRSGFELFLEDENDRRSRHCEFAAIRSTDGKRFTVEAKSRAVAGFLGRTNRDGGNDDNPLGKLKTHLHDALDKPSAHDRLVFIDINAPIDPNDANAKMALVVRAADILQRYEGHPTAPQSSAYVFVVNMGFHRYLDAPPLMVVAPLGFRIPDFNKAAPISIVERYRQDQKHKAAYDIARSLHAVGDFPATFDGSLPSETLHGERPRIKIGETYEFDGQHGPVRGTVTSATVAEPEKEVWMVIRTDTGHEMHVEKMSDAAFGDWRENKAAYFGKVQDVPTNPKTPLELYARFMEMMADYDRKALALQIGKLADDPAIAHLADDELREFVCNGFVQGLQQTR